MVLEQHHIWAYLKEKNVIDIIEKSYTERLVNKVIIYTTKRVATKYNVIGYLQLYSSTRCDDIILLGQSALPQLTQVPSLPLHIYFQQSQGHLIAV